MSRLSCAIRESPCKLAVQTTHVTLWMFDGHQETNQPLLIYSFIWPIQIPFVDRKVTYTIQIHGKYVHHCWFKYQFKLNHVLKMFGFPWYGTSILHCYIATINLFWFYYYCIFLIYFQYIALNHKLASTKTGIYIDAFLGKILRMPMCWTQCGPDCSQWTGLTPTLKNKSVEPRNLVSSIL